MSQDNNIGKKEADLLDQSSALFGRSEIPFEKSREEAWEEISGRLHSQGKAVLHPGPLVFSRRSMALAATLALLLSLGTFLRLYRVQSICPAGENISIELPDGSMAELNEQTILSYHPLWWPVSRKIQLEGEAFFNVEEGKKFTVQTPQGRTEVLGTTFTVYSREDSFAVTCHSGRVKVMQVSSDHSLTLSRNEKATVNSTGGLEMLKVNVDPFIPAWRGNLLKFTSTPLREVFDLIEKQYGIRIETPEDMDFIYTGNLVPGQSVEKIISLICRPFDLVYEKRSGSEYQIIPPSVD